MIAYIKSIKLATWYMIGLAVIGVLQTGMTFMGYDDDKIGAWLGGYFIAAAIYRLRCFTA